MVEGDNKDQKNGQTTQDGKSTSVNVQFDPEGMKELIRKLHEAEEKSKKQEDDIAKLMKEKTDLATSFEEKETELESAEEKLKLVAAQKIADKKKVIMDEAKKYIKDEDRLKKMEDELKTPEDIKATEFMIETLAKAVAAGEKEDAKLKLIDKFPDAKPQIDAVASIEDLTKLEADLQKAADEAMAKAITDAKGELLKEFPDAKDKIETVKTSEDLDKLTKELKPAQGDNQGVDNKDDKDNKGGAGQITLDQQSGVGPVKGEYESHEAMIRDLYRRKHSDDPEEAAEADAILDELFKKWSAAVKKRYGEFAKPIDIERGKEQKSVRELTKKGGAA